MNGNLLIKLVIDLAMIVLILVAMAYHFTDNTIHELVGVFMFILFLVHNILNLRWYKTCLKGKHNVRSILSMVVNLLLLAVMAVLMISAVPLSQDIFAFLSINNGMSARQTHVLAAYWGFILIAVHVGMHWGMIINSVRKMTRIRSKNCKRTIALRVLVVLIVVYGVQASFDRNVGSKLILYYSFDFLDFNESAIRFLFDYLSVMGVYICGSYYALKFVKKQENIHKKTIKLDRISIGRVKSSSLTNGETGTNHLN